jgi:hypothetical protein
VPARLLKSLPKRVLNAACQPCVRASLSLNVVSTAIRRLLRARRAPPCNRRAAQNDEVPPPHGSIPAARWIKLSAGILSNFAASMGGKSGIATRPHRPPARATTAKQAPIVACLRNGDLGRSGASRCAVHITPPCPLAFPGGDALRSCPPASRPCPISDNLHGDCQFRRHPYKVRGGRRRARGDGRPRRSCSTDTIPISSRSRW